jgi:hypothetical protein
MAANEKGLPKAGGRYYIMIESNQAFGKPMLGAWDI